MIVTKVYSQSAWVKVTYHSSDKLNHPIVDLTPFSKLYGYRIKSSGY
ncbi:MAG: hypothetical protein IPP17_30170 [Bacteroidetes bacterium]|nr:hypothetical protein [Bacteroidota bacterium]